MTVDIIREVLQLRLAFNDLVERVCLRGENPETVPLVLVAIGIREMGRERAGALVFAAHQTESYEEGIALVDELLVWLDDDRRPRSASVLRGLIDEL